MRLGIAVRRLRVHRDNAIANAPCFWPALKSNSLSRGRPLFRNGFDILKALRRD